MVEENISQKFRLKNIDETRNYLLSKVKQNDLCVESAKRFVQLSIILNTFFF